MSDTDTKQCYNKGCGKRYNPAENKDDSCHYHPGVPVFHDALKGWSCCKKRSTDFTEFLNIPGCTAGPHSNVKPVEPDPEKNNEKKDELQTVKETTIVRAPEKPPLERPSENEPMIRLPYTVGSSLQQALEKQMKEMTLETSDDKGEVDPSITKVGTLCKNAGCTKEYRDESTNTEQCTFHSGVPIFHEGMKYWSCCKRKTSDFNSFLNQEGCTTGKHLWYKKESEESKVVCRVDWHQTASFVTVSIFSKLTQPDKSWVEANGVSLRVKLVFDGGKKQFEKSVVLKGIVDPKKSNVKMLGTKVEINLKKVEPGNWTRLELNQC
ncbi:hypothetical protein LSH36_306g01046 [Paralvinella palmiformis]|uniref:Cysteine and histidine-rich domain-containing protein 1 n=1 Tax=Paralvinella palmiformis TaxID=53620 RepID=A0AAD9JJ33_9ANNE|nr:hypothetical protein LSH36_306g01046 [Paralvinella palmiformis]